MIDLAIDPTSQQPVAEEEGKIDPFATEESSVRVSEDVATNRAGKMDFVLGPDSPGIGALKNAVELGNLEGYRSKLANIETAKRRRVAMDLTEDYLMSKKGPVSETEAQLVGGLLNIYEPSEEEKQVIFEKEYGRKVVEFSLSLNDESVDEDGFIVAEDPGEANLDLDKASDIITRHELALRKLEEVEAKLGEKGIIGKGYEFIESILPTNQWLNTFDATENAKTSSILPGSNIADQIQYLRLLPIEQFWTEFSKAVDLIAEDNLVEAANFAQLVIGINANDEFLINAFGIADAIDLGIIGGAAKVAKGAGKAATRTARITRNAAQATANGQLKQHLAHVVQSVRSRAVNPGDFIANAGNITLGSSINAIKRVRGSVDNMDKTGQMKVLQDQIPSLFNPSVVTKATMNWAQEATERLVTSLNTSASHLLKTMTDVSQVNRLTDSALSVAYREAYADVIDNYPAMNNAIIMVERNAPDESIAQVGSINVILGKKDASFFSTVGAAKNSARNIYGLPEGSFDIGQQGSGFYIRVSRDLDETSPGVLNALIDTENLANVSFANTWIGMLRNPDDILSNMNRGNRNSLTYGANEIVNHMREAAKSIGTLGKSKLADLERILQANRDFPDPVTGLRGKFHSTVLEVEEAYASLLNRLPSEREVEAYFKYVQLNDLDWYARNLSIYKFWSRKGFKNTTFSYKVRNADDKLETVPTPEFIGKYRDRLPNDSDPEGIVYVVDHITGNAKEYSTKGMNPRVRKDLENRIAGGYRIVEVGEPLKKPLADSLKTDSAINFVVVKDTKTGRLPANMLPYRPGFHVDYQYEWYLKQPVISRKNGLKYYGDNTLLNGATRAEMAKYGDILNEVRQLLKAPKKNAAAIQKLVTDKLPWSVKEVTGWFRGKNAIYSLDDEIMVTRSGANTYDQHKLKDKMTGLVNEVSSPYNHGGQLDTAFIQERGHDVPTIREGSQHNPTVRVDKAKKFDVQATVNRALRRVIRNRYYDDYKISSVNSMIEQFADVTDVSKDTLRLHPLSFLYNPRWNENADPTKLAVAKQMRTHVLNLVSQPSDTQRKLDIFKSKFLDSIYNRFGQQRAEYFQDHLIPGIKDPTSYFRAIGFHTKLGLFNPVQLFLQAQTLTHINGVMGPDLGLKGVGAAFFARRLALTEDPAKIAKAGEMLEKVSLGGWKKDDFIESYTELRKTGMYHIEGEVAQLDDVMTPELFRGKLGTMLDKGAFFFKEGERIVRLTAWHAAYKEWREVNPGTRLTSQARNRILNRANDLTVNMTRSSNAMWQQGLSSIPTQFFSYQVRLMEQMLPGMFGKGRLTRAEAWRTFGMYSAVYGVPTATGAVTAVWPWYEDVRKTLLEKGVEYDDTVFEALMDGIPSVVIEVLGAMKGREEGDSDYNLAERYGPGGLPVFREVWRGEKSVIDVLTGASGTILGDIISHAEPVVANLMDIASDDPDAYQPAAEEFLDAIRDISSVNNAVKGWYAYNTGKYLSKNEVYLDDVTSWDALFIGITGLTPSELSDTFRMIESMSDHKEMQKEARQMIIKNIRRGLRAESEDEKLNYYKAARKWYIMGGFLPNEYGEVVREAARGYEDLVSKINLDFERMIRVKRSTDDARKQRNLQ